MLEQSYTSRAAGSASNSAEPVSSGEYWSLDKLRRAYSDYLTSKREEIDEQIEARRYYHGSHWTSEQVASLKKRKQPIMTFNRIARKIDGVVGLIERLRQDPKAYARTPQHEEGAELATATVRYVLDEQQWKAISPQVAQDGAVDGIGGIALELEQGDQGDPEIGLDLIDIQSFFYDPRSYEMDFDDARYMGIGKWLDHDIAEEMFPEAPSGAFQSDHELTSNTDREQRWFRSDGVVKRVRIVDIWYKHKGGWCWAIFSGNAILMEGKSYLKDEKKKDICKYIPFSANVDQDGDRYGFVRNMKSAQDGINAKQSKMQFMIASKRLLVRKGMVDSVEKTRAEYGRPDGVVEINGDLQSSVKTDDQTFDFTGLGKLLELNLAEIENFGPNPALIGQGIENKSGRAIALLQQAGMAELGPYILAYRGWKIRVYRAIWNAVQQHWKAERWIRVTDDENLAQFIQINGLQIDPRTGAPTIQNAVGSLDVDIIMDEAPDSVTLQGQSFEVLQSLGPAFVEKFPEIAIELSPLDTATKRKVREKTEAAAQAQQPVQQTQLAGEQAKVVQTQADAELKQAQTMKTMVEAQLHPQAVQNEGMAAMFGGQPQGEHQVPPELQNMQAMADIENTQADTAQKHAAAYKTQQEGALAPQQMAMDQANAEADRREASRNAEADRKIAAQKAKQKPPARR